MYKRQRLSLSSSSVDEVIKKRVLEKNEAAEQLLQMEYEKEASGLKSLFAFDNPILDIKGFSNATEFIETFPFVPYQFIIIQKTMAEIRKHGNAGHHYSGVERSMLSGFQEAAQKDVYKRQALQCLCRSRYRKSRIRAASSLERMRFRIISSCAIKRTC